MHDAVASLLNAYAKANTRRADGGIYAMAGFAYQAELSIAEAVTVLVASNDFSRAGQVFVEALSDLAVQQDDGSLVLLQVKRTLTGATLDSAADEVAAIEAVDASLPNPVRPCYGVVCQHRSIDLDWARLPSTSKHTALVNRLLTEGRLRAPRQQPNPRWQALAALWDCHSDPFGFLRFALDRILHRQVEVADAAACWEALAERFRQGRIRAVGYGHRLDAGDVHVSTEAGQRLEVGKRVTWERWRRGQYMPRHALANDAVSRVLALRDQAVQSSSAELSVFWLAGRSGAGKSVVLLNVVSELVVQGHSVLWLKPEELEPALARIAQGEHWVAPDFMAVDDIFDPDARDRIDLGRISILVDEQGARQWPVLLTCGPSEFADDFAEQSRYQGFAVQTYDVPLLDRAATEGFVDWATPFLVANDSVLVDDRWSGQAVSQGAQGQGLFVSVATEIASGDMRHFGQRFAERLRRHGDEFTRRLRLCLAVNRLYMRAPASWLEGDDRTHLEDVNRDGDFALEAAEAGQDWLRLTHPHLSDAIYPHLLQAARPRLFADDLGDAFQRALSGGHDALAQRLLRAFSAQAGQARVQRMLAVDEQHLAERCVQAWRAHPAGGDIRLQAGMRVSLACWEAARPSLGRTIDDLIADALRDIDQAETQFAGLGWWPAWWIRLWAHHPRHAALVEWAVLRLARSADQPESAWSRVWESVWGDAQGERRALLHNAGRQWLRSNGHKADWHFVWKALHANPEIDRSSLADLLTNALPYEDGGHWAHVWQEALQSPPSGNALPLLIAQGCEWLTGREDKEQWKFVWEALLARPQALPEDWSEPRLVQLGCEWLAEREDKDQWNFVWQALLARLQALPEHWSEPRLVQLGCEWLAEREDKDQWAYVWQALLARSHALPNGWHLQRLAEVAIHFVGQTTGSDAALPLLTQLLKHWQLLAIAQQQAIGNSLGRWISAIASIPAGPASHFIEALLEAGLGEVTGCRTAAIAWCERAHGHASWPLIVVKCLLVWPTEPLLDAAAAQLAERVSKHPNAGWLRKADLLLQKVDLETSSAELATLTEAIRSRKLLPQWATAEAWHEAQSVVRADVRVVGRQFIAELPGGLYAVLNPAPPRLRPEQSLDVVVIHLDRTLDRVVCRPASVGSDMPAVGQQAIATVTGHQRYGVFVKVGAAGGLVLSRNLFGPPEGWPNLLPVQSQWKVRITGHKPQGFNAELVEPPWTQAAMPAVGQVSEATITGHKVYGIFVRVGASSGLIHRSTLPVPEDQWPIVFPMHSRWSVRVVSHTAKGFGCELVAPP